MTTDASPAATTSLPASSAPTEGPVLRADEVVRTFEIGGSTIEVLRGVSMQVQAGESLFLCGASGAGKTSLLYTLAGLEAPNAGRVEVLGQSLYELGKRHQARVRNQSMGYVFQSYALLPELTAIENVLIPSMMRGRPDRSRAAELLDQVGLSHRGQHLPTELSGGEQQRVAIARALMNNPEIIFADEPTGNLDSKTGASIMDALIKIVREERKTLLVVTHDSKLAESGDRTLVLKDGRIVT